MGELTLIYGPAHPDKTSPAYERCLASLDAGDGESFLWLLPTHFQAQLMRRQLIRANSTDLLTGHLALDLNSFTDILSNLCPSQRPALPLSAQRPPSRRRPRGQRGQRGLLQPPPRAAEPRADSVVSSIGGDGHSAGRSGGNNSAQRGIAGPLCSLPRASRRWVERKSRAFCHRGCPPRPRDARTALPPTSVCSCSAALWTCPRLFCPC